LLGPERVSPRRVTSYAALSDTIRADFYFPFTPEYRHAESGAAALSALSVRRAYADLSA